MNTMGKLLLATMTVILGSLALAFSLFQVPQENIKLVFQHARTGEVFLEFPVKVGDEVTLSWIHSVEKTPWNETYQVNDDYQLLLKRTSFKSYGAGVPHQKGESRTENGLIIYDKINELFDELSWIHSHNTKHHLIMNDEMIVSFEELPHHEPIKLSIEKR
jgi:hypothetical protein